MPVFPKSAVPMSKFYLHMDAIEPVIRNVERLKVRREQPVFFDGESSHEPAVHPGDSRYHKKFDEAATAIGSALDFVMLQRDHFKETYQKNQRDVATLKQTASNWPFLQKLSCYRRIYSPKYLWYSFKMRRSIGELESQHGRLAQAYAYLQEIKPRKK